MDFEAPILDLVRLSLESFTDDKKFINHFIDTFHSDDTFFVENENDMPAGVMHMLRFTDSKGHRAGYFYGLFTMLIHRRKGIGRGLISDAIATLYCDGYDYAVLIPHSKEAMRWYKKVGFKTLNNNSISVRAFDGCDLTTGKDNSLPAMYYDLHDNFNEIPADNVITIPKPE